MKKAKLQTNLTRQAKGAFYFATLTCASVSCANAEGFRNSTIGAFDLGRSGGRIAQVDDATAVQNNPANLVDIKDVVAELDPSFIYISANYQGPNGQSATTLHPLKVLPNFFLAAPIADGRAVLGFGVTVPYGLASQWVTSSSAFARPGGNLGLTTPFYGKLTTYNFNPEVAFKVCDEVQVGVGLDVMYSQVELRQFLSPYLPELQAHGYGDGVGVGGNMGVTWKITDHQRLALNYRSTMTVDYSGTTRFENYLVPLPNTSFDSQIKFPNIISAGLWH